MTIANASVVALYGLTALNWTIHWYTQMVTYYLFPEVARQAGGQGFVAYHRAYQRRLVWAIYLPWSLLMAASIAAVMFVSGEAAMLWLLLALNAAIGVLSVAVAVPIHARVDRQGRLDPIDAVGLLRANLARLAVASASLFVSTILVFHTFQA